MKTTESFEYKVKSRIVQSWAEAKTAYEQARAVLKRAEEQLAVTARYAISTAPEGTSSVILRNGEASVQVVFYDGYRWVGREYDKAAAALQHPRFLDAKTVTWIREDATEAVIEVLAKHAPKLIERDLEITTKPAFHEAFLRTPDDIEEILPLVKPKAPAFRKI